MCEGGARGNDGIRTLSGTQLGDILAWSLAHTDAKALGTADTLSMTNYRGTAPLPRAGFSLCLGPAEASRVGGGPCLWPKFAWPSDNYHATLPHGHH